MLTVCPAPGVEEVMTVVLMRGAAGYGFGVSGGADTAVGLTTVMHVEPSGPAFGKLLVGDTLLELNHNE